MALCFLFYYPSRRSDSSAWKTRGETDCLWLTPFPLIQLLENPGGLPGGGDGKVPRMRRKGEYVGMVLGDTRMWKFLEAKENMVVWGKGKSSAQLEYRG